MGCLKLEPKKTPRENQLPGELSDVRRRCQGDLNVEASPELRGDANSVASTNAMLVPIRPIFVYQ
jgi:hypothetical protein